MDTRNSAVRRRLFQVRDTPLAPDLFLFFYVTRLAAVWNDVDVPHYGTPRTRITNRPPPRTLRAHVTLADLRT